MDYEVALFNGDIEVTEWRRGPSPIHFDAIADDATDLVWCVPGTRITDDLVAVERRFLRSPAFCARGCNVTISGDPGVIIT